MKEKVAKAEMNGDVAKEKRKSDATVPIGVLKKKQQKELEKQEAKTERIEKLNGTKDPEVPSTSGESMAVILTQGLMAQDREKLDSVLTKSDIKVIQTTLSELSVTNIVPLLKVIEANLMSRNVVDIRPWLRWAQATLSMHMSYLSTLPTLEEELGSLMEWMRSRSANTSRLLALHGKMCVLVEHIEKRSNKHLEPLPQPIVVFKTDQVASSDDEESALEDSDARSSENEDWWDDVGLLKDDDMDGDSSSDDESDDEEFGNEKDGQEDVDMVDDEEDSEDDGDDENEDDDDEVSDA